MTSTFTVIYTNEGIGALLERISFARCHVNSAIAGFSSFGSTLSD
ncbi:hypothetical protein [Paenibacillus sp. 22594]